MLKAALGSREKKSHLVDWRYVVTERYGFDRLVDPGHHCSPNLRRRSRGGTFRFTALLRKRGLHMRSHLKRRRFNAE